MKTPMLAGVSDADIQIESLRQTADRASASVYSTLLGIGFVLLTQWDTSHTSWLVAFVTVRLFFVAHNHWVETRIRAFGAREAIRQGYDHRLVFGMAGGGVSWGLLVGLLAPPAQWLLNDHLIVIILVLVSALVLVTTAYMRSAMIAFTASLWGTTSVLLFALHWPLPWQILAGVPVVGVVLMIYGMQLHRQSREGVILDLINRRLNAELESANGQLHDALGKAVEMATQDSLTKALNRRAFLERAQGEASAMRRQGEAACVLILDMDHFKRINDHHGHAVGDSVLVNASATVQSCLRDIDTMARWGGEEFVVLMPRTSLESGALVAERIRLAVANLSHPDWPIGLAPSVSIGMAAWAPHQAVEAALHQADGALYLAKDGGRNRVSVAHIS